MRWILGGSDAKYKLRSLWSCVSCALLMLDVRRLRVLRQVAHDGTIAEAARSLHMTGPAISQHLHALEREAGAKLLERDGRTLRLTAAAQTLVAHTETILAQLELAQADLDASEARFGGELRVAAFPTAALTLLAPAVGSLLALHPRAPRAGRRARARRRAAAAAGG